MIQLDLIVFMVAGIIGAVGVKWPYGGSLAWGIIAVYCLIRLLKVV